MHADRTEMQKMEANAVTDAPAVAPVVPPRSPRDAGRCRPASPHLQIFHDAMKKASKDKGPET